MAKEFKAYTYRGVTFKTWNDASSGLVLSERRIKNLLDMAYAIQNSPPPKFDMAAFYSFEDEDRAYQFLDLDYALDPHDLNRVSKLPEKEINICGTAACAIGTAAFNGVGKLTRGMDWDDYSRETFGIESGTDIWAFLFSGNWSYEGDNTPEGAVARILMLVDKGPKQIISTIEDVRRFSHYWSLNYDRLIPLYQDYKKVVLTE